MVGRDGNSHLQVGTVRGDSGLSPQRILAHLLSTRDVLCGLHTRTWEAALSGQVPSLLRPQFVPLYCAGCELTSKR